VALCNSSEKAARVAIKKYHLPETTKAYGDPHALAADPGVDLIVCCVRVDRHYATIKPALEAGKDVFVEWPLAANRKQAEELGAIAAKSGSKTIVGLQTRSSPQIQKIRELIATGAVGKVLSSTYSYQLGFLGDIEPPGIDYIAKKEVGGNILTVLFAHAADPVFHALGDQPSEVTAILRTQWPKTKLLHADGSFNKIIDRETADHVFVQAVLPKGDVPISITVRGGNKWKDAPSLVWQILGTEGMIQLTSPPSHALDLGTSTIELHTNATDTVEVVPVQFPDSVKDLPSTMAQNIGLLYEQFATEKGNAFVDFEEALKVHRLIDALEKSSEARGTVTAVE
jgi:predicted dehydrogenase